MTRHRPKRRNNTPSHAHASPPRVIGCAPARHYREAVTADARLRFDPRRLTRSAGRQTQRANERPVAGETVGWSAARLQHPADLTQELPDQLGLSVCSGLGEHAPDMGTCRLALYSQIVRYGDDWSALRRASSSRRVGAAARDLGTLFRPMAVGTG